MINERFANRFNELEAEFLAIPYDDAPYAAARAWLKWATSVKSLLLAACRENSPHYTNFVKLLETCTGHREGIESLGGVFLSAKEAFESGYLFDVERDVSAEIFGDFVVLAKRALSDNNTDVAAVLASAALEDALTWIIREDGDSGGDTGASVWYKRCVDKRLATTEAPA